MNPLDMLKMIKNPQQYVMEFMKQNGNPMLNNLVSMAQKNDVKGLENFAKNILREQGQDYDSIMNLFR